MYNITCSCHTNMDSSQIQSRKMLHTYITSCSAAHNNLLPFDKNVVNVIFVSSIEIGNLTNEKCLIALVSNSTRVPSVNNKFLIKKWDMDNLKARNHIVDFKKRSQDLN